MLEAPSDLANRIKELANTDPFGTPPAPFFGSDQFRCLVDAAFHASMLADEGRFPRFRIIYHRNPLRLAAPFVRAIPLDAPTLRRLAPTVSDSACALCIAPDYSKGAACVGIAHLRPFWQSKVFGFPQSRVGYTVLDFALTVDGPGSMRGCVNSSNTCVLHGGRIRTLRSIQGITAFQLLLHQILQTLFLGADSELLTFYGTPAVPSCVGDLIAVWSAVLSATLHLGHGGAFVVLPTAGISDRSQIEKDYRIRCKYEIDVEAGKAFIQYARAIAGLRQFQVAGQDKSLSSESMQEYQRLANVFVNAEEGLKDTIRTVAGLSSTDGCGVLDRSLTVRGFGGEIRESDQRLRPLYRCNSDEEIPEEKVDAYGMRHRSACRFSQRHDDVFLFVISQDKELTLFHSDKTRANRWDSLDAVPFTSDLD
jgi:hypothetical protein